MNQLFSTTLVILYWCPMVIWFAYATWCLGKSLQEDFIRRSNGGHYYPLVTVGVVLFGILAGIVPVANSLLVILVVIPDVFDGAFEKISDILDKPISSAKSKE